MRQEGPFLPEAPVHVLRHVLVPLVARVQETQNQRLHAQLMNSLEHCLVEYALETAGNQMAAAELLGVSRNTVRNKMRKYGIRNTRRSRRSAQGREDIRWSGGAGI
ncbi:MAG: helix-turn-helix domain-containing protein [bacterium]